MNILSNQLSDYLNNLVPPRSALFQEMEIRAEKDSFPIIGPACGHVCYQVARMVGATRIFELGSGFGYSTAWFAQAVKENGGGEVHHVVWEEELSSQAKNALDELGYAEIVHYTVGEAVASLHEAEGEFDLIFCDIDKEGYPQAIQVAEKKLRPGGMLIVDNMLWSGRIFDESDQSADTKGIREATGMLASSDKWITSILPIRDGLLMALKKG
jgi:predicted O-methyltransferase YrrM